MTKFSRDCVSDTTVDLERGGGGVSFGVESAQDATDGRSGPERKTHSRAPIYSEYPSAPIVSVGRAPSLLQMDPPMNPNTEKVE